MRKSSMKRRANGEGSIYQRKDGLWAASITLDHGRRKTFYGKTSSQVREKLAAAQRAKQDGLPVVPERQTVAQFLEDWLKGARASLRPRTARRYGELVRLHIVPEIGALSIARLEPRHLEALYASRQKAGFSPTTVVQMHAVLHRALNQAVTWGNATRNVADFVNRPRITRREMTALSPEQARTCLAAAGGDRLEALYVLAITGGLRQGELLALRWRNVDVDRGRLEVVATLQRSRDGADFCEPKTARSRRQVTLSRTAIEALRRHRVAQAEERLRLGAHWQDNDLVFPDEVGQPGNADHVRRAFWRLLERAGLPRVRFHDLRHSAATLMLGQGVHPKIVSEMLGHSGIAITLDLYSHVTPTMQREAADAMDAALGR